MTANPNSRPPFPPFTRETAAQKVRMAEDAWNTRDPERVSLAYTVDSTWRNRAEFLSGRIAELVSAGQVDARPAHAPKPGGDEGAPHIFLDNHEPYGTSIRGEGVLDLAKTSS